MASPLHDGNFDQQLTYKYDTNNYYITIYLQLTSCCSYEIQKTRKRAKLFEHMDHPFELRHTHMNKYE